MFCFVLEKKILTFFFSPFSLFFFSYQVATTNESKPHLTSTVKEVKSYTWQEVAKHNTAESCWVSLKGKVYDVTEFLPRHPGGKEILLLSAGRECTDLFNSYHWRTLDKSTSYLSQFEIGTLSGPTEHPVFAPDTQDLYGKLSKRIKQYFEETKKEPKQLWPGVWRVVLQIVIGLVSFVASMNYLSWAAPLFSHFGFTQAATFCLSPSPLPFWAQCIAAIVYGIFQVMPLLHAMHDASHTAIGPNEMYWKFLGRLTHDWYVGGSMISWHHQHIIGHHQYTNVFLADPDIPYRVDGDLRRIVGDQSWIGVYKWQWLYLPMLYAFLALKVRVSDVTDTWLARTSGPMRVNFYDSVFVRIFLVKGSWIFWRTVLPLLYLPITWQKYWALWLITEFTSGLWLAWNFEVSHLAPEAYFPETMTGEEVVLSASSKGEKKSTQTAVKYAPGQKVVPKSWIVTQIESSVDYAHDAPLTTWWCGALNYQIEHHLFPGISQYHYPALAPIVKEFCKENNIRYNYEPTFVAAWMKHVKLLVEMGQKGFAYKWD